MLFIDIVKNRKLIALQLELISITNPGFITNKPNLIKDDFVPPALFDKTHWFIDSNLLKNLSDQDKSKATSVIDFFSTKTPPNLDSIMTYSGIEDPSFKKSVSKFVESEKTSSRLENQTSLKPLSSLKLSGEEKKLK